MKRDIHRWHRVLAVSSAVLLGTLTGCVQSDSSTSSARSNQAVPFGGCTSENLPPIEGDASLELDGDRFRAGERVTFTWLGSQLVLDAYAIECWTGQDWQQVWFTENAFNSPRSRVLRDGPVLTVNDEGFEERSGVIPIPDETPPGVYTMRAFTAEARFEVVAE